MNSEKPSPIRVVQYGLGPIGQGTASLILEKQKTGKIQLVGAIDTDPKKVNQTVGSLTNTTSDIIISAEADQVLSESSPDVVVHTTSSFMPQVEQQLNQCILSGASVVSSTEELPYPFDRHPNIANRLDTLAKDNGVSILGTGVNPGYAMDILALVATGVCTNVESVRVQRCVDAGLRRLPLQKKVGAGITVEEFHSRQSLGGFGHIGLVESLRLVMNGLGWPIEHYSELLEPVICEEKVETNYITVEPGRVAGIKHTAEAVTGGRVAVSLELQMFVGAKQPEDRVIVNGDPPINLVVEDGIFGDTATVGALINAIPQVFNASPGLKTVNDLPVPRCYLPKV